MGAVRDAHTRTHTRTGTYTHKRARSFMLRIEDKLEQKRRTGLGSKSCIRMKTREQQGHFGSIFIFQPFHNKPPCSISTAPSSISVWNYFYSPPLLMPWLFLVCRTFQIIILPLPMTSCLLSGKRKRVQYQPLAMPNKAMCLLCSGAHCAFRQTSTGLPFTAPTDWLHKRVGGWACDGICKS